MRPDEGEFVTMLRRTTITLGLLGAVSLLLHVRLNGADEVKSGTLEGTVRGKPSQQLVLAVPDQPRHVLGLVEAKGTYDGPTALLAGAAVRTVEKWDLIGGTGGEDRGFIVFTVDQDQLIGSYTGTVRPADGGRSSLSGQMRFQSGSGRFAGIQGEATYTGLADKESFEFRFKGQYNKK